MKVKISITFSEDPVVLTLCVVLKQLCACLSAFDMQHLIFCGKTGCIDE